ncbi:MAG: hypothetical protein LBC83_05180 [Oscillospiraceae bacterium]|jgi:hypothetical protein|nr:hypothetical protein [Oscillospiraceae bacterium]
MGATRVVVYAVVSTGVIAMCVAGLLAAAIALDCVAGNCTVEADAAVMLAAPTLLAGGVQDVVLGRVSKALCVTCVLALACVSVFSAAGSFSQAVSRKNTDIQRNMKVLRFIA